jgi:uncharacterized protein
MIKKIVSQKLVLECLIVYGCVPFIIAITRPTGWIYIGLWGFLALALRELYSRGYSFKADWNWAAMNRANITTMLRRFVPCAVGMLIFTYIMIPDQLFSLPQQKPWVWLAVLVLYPLVSVVPQEILFRTYFLNRYSLFMSPHVLRLTCAIAFGWAHVALLNWVAVVFSMIGSPACALSMRCTAAIYLPSALAIIFTTGTLLASFLLFLHRAWTAKSA